MLSNQDTHKDVLNTVKGNTDTINANVNNVLNKVNREIVYSFVVNHSLSSSTLESTQNIGQFTIQEHMVPIPNWSNGSYDGTFSNLLRNPTQYIYHIEYNQILHADKMLHYRVAGRNGSSADGHDWLIVNCVFPLNGVTNSMTFKYSLKVFKIA